MALVTSRLLLVLSICLWGIASHAHAASECIGTEALEQAFSSGASWSLCASVSEAHGLEVSEVYYRAPGDASRSVLLQAQVGQILLHYHNEEAPLPQVGDADAGRLITMRPDSCDGALLLDNGTGPTLCSRILDNRLLSKYEQRPGLQSERWELVSAIERDGLVWAISIGLSEDGQITPAVSLSGRMREASARSAETNAETSANQDPDQSAADERFVALLPENERYLPRATVLTNWRVVFDLDTPAVDSIQQLDFALNVALGNRRPMTTGDISNESFATVERETFRSWRVIDSTGASYLLDPSNSGFSYVGSPYNWARFDVAFTQYKPCERYASDNLQSASDDDQTTCGDSLDDFISGETLSQTHPVLWFSQSRTISPTDEHWPVVSNFYQSFTLLPFDWSAASPFEVIE